MILSLLRFALRRLLAQCGLALASAVGLVVSVALVTSIPLYADATQFRIMREQIGGAPDIADDAPLAFYFRYAAQPRNGPQWIDVVAVDDYLTRAANRTVGLPQSRVVRLFRTGAFKLFPPSDPNSTETQYLLTWINFAFLNNPEVTTRLIAGAYPSPQASPDGPIEIVISESAATEFGILVGDSYLARRDDGPEIPVRVVGIWAPVDPRADFWEVRAVQLALVAESAYVSRVGPLIDDELYGVAWFVVMDGSKLHAGDIAPLPANIQTMQQRAESLLPGIKLETSPLAELKAYQAEAPALTLLLYAFSIPILGLILAFVGLVAGLFVSQRRNEIAILRSRGASVLQVTFVATLEGLLLGVAALAAGIPGGVSLAHAIGRARSFLNFTAPAALRVSLTPQDVWFGVLAMGAVLLLLLIGPTLGAAQHTIITYKQDRARSVRPPGWQRAWLDLLLLIPTAYGIYVLNQQGSLAAAPEAALPDPLRNPLLLIVPALGIFAVTLFVLRIIPALMAAIAWAAARTDSVGLLMAARYLSRTPAFYNAPMALLVLTLSLSAFTASLAQTLDRHLYRQTYYEVGSNLRLRESGTTFNSEDTQNPVWTFEPVDEHLRLPGVRAVARVGRYPATALRLSGDTVEGVYLGIDRLTFPQVAFWQSNFADEQLAAMMNALGAAPDGVLVSRSFMDGEGLHVGDTVTLGVSPGQPVGFTAPIVGVIDLFPTWYPEDGPLFVGNLDSLFSQMGTAYIHEVWLRTDSNSDHDLIVRSVRGFSAMLDPDIQRRDVIENGLNTFVDEWASASVRVTTEQRRPERQGLFGLLSVGFGASALLTVLGFLLYALFSFRRRFIEMGMLRAIGLSANQLRALLASELVFLILIGLGVGTLLGVAVSQWFIPYLQLGTATTAHYPPFI
ncbi:MAG TPA: ABC transporter permease, partial [Anaerolineales bacterium]|nr:ABC transporter permease [Anaerolineales bacterium]